VNTSISRREGKLSSRKVDTVIIDPALGLSGDMFMGCLFELGASPVEVTDILSGLSGLEPFSITTERAEARGIQTLRTRVTFERAHHSRNFSQISDMISSSGMESSIIELSLEIFGAIARAEGKAHGMDPANVHFHEVGAVDSIVDIVGSVAALYLLGFPRMYHRPLRLGSGTISISHGEIPVPAPATVEILRGRALEISEETGEVVTPTGAALLAVLADPLPSGRLFKPKRIVYASGTRDQSENPGFLRMIEAQPAGDKNRVRVIRTTIDDMNPETYGYASEKLFEAGAHEVYLNNIMMKKGRPGIELTVICDSNIEEQVLELLFTETTTLGIRIADEERVELRRWSDTVKTGYGEVAVKFRKLCDGVVNFSPEYESAARLARMKNIPLEKVYREAVSAAMKRMEEKGES
jgi:hypothetical protein